MSEHIATLKSGNYQLHFVDFGRPVWFETPNPESLEIEGWRLVPTPGFEIRDALIQYFGRELGLSLDLNQIVEDALIDVNEDPNNPVRAELLQEVLTSDASGIELILVNAQIEEFARELEVLQFPPVVRIAESEDVDLTTSPFGALVRGLKDVAEGRVHRADHLFGEDN
jgi:hypothetical protein